MREMSSDGNDSHSADASASHPSAESEAPLLQAASSSRITGRLRTFDALGTETDVMPLLSSE
jgi:hypothetical protein